MKYDRLAPLSTAAALSVLYLSFVYAFARSDLLQRATAVEQVIFVLQVGKLIVILSVDKLRNGKFVNIVNILGAEVVVALPVLALANVALGDPGTSALLGQIFLGWIAGAAVAVSPYSIYRLAVAMIRRESLIVVLTSGVLLSELVLLLQAGTASAQASGQGLASLSRTIILLGGGAVASGDQAAGLVTLLPLSVLYVSLLLHSLSPSGGVKPARFAVVVGLAVLATAITYSGTYLALLLATPFAYLVMAPTLLTAALIWWRTREA